MWTGMVIKRARNGKPFIAQKEAHCIDGSPLPREAIQPMIYRAANDGVRIMAVYCNPRYHNLVDDQGNIVA